MKSVIVIPENPAQLEAILKKYPCEYVRLEGTYSTALKVIIMAAEEVSGFRMRHANVEAYMPEDMKKRYDGIIPKLLKNRNTKNLATAFLPGVTAFAILGAADKPLYLIKGASREADYEILGLKPKYYQMIDETTLSIWEAFSKMGEKGRTETAAEIFNFLKEREKLDNEISSWWDKEFRRLLSEADKKTSSG